MIHDHKGDVNNVFLLPFPPFMMTTSTYETRQLEEKLDREASRFLDPIYSKYPSSPDALHVTLTFAQSVDAKIAGKGKKMLPLSCKESMIMTHK